MATHPYEAWTCHAGDLAFTLRAPAGWADEQRHYLSHYLPGPVHDRDLGTFHLAVHLDDAEYHRIVRQARTPPTTRSIEPVPGVVLWEKRASSGARYYAVASDGLEHQAEAYAVKVHERQIELYLHHSARTLHGYPLRLMREAMLRTYEDNGECVFHAAGADLNGHGVMVCGPRSAGKTTLLASLLRATRGSLLANDRLLLAPGGRLIAVPLPVPVGKGTLDAIGELSSAIPALSRPQKTIRALPTTFGATEKAEFSAREFATALGGALTAGSWLRTILLPVLTDSSEPARIRALPPQEIQQILAANCFTPHDEFWQQPWLVPRRTAEGDLRRRAEQLAQSIAGHTPCFEVRFGVHNPLAELEAIIHEAVSHTP